MTFKSADGQSLGQVGICLADEYRDNHLAVFVTPDEDGHSVIRRGLSIPNTRELTDLLDRQFIE